jgi:mono/diheme cytochrome c family protein
MRMPVSLNVILLVVGSSLFYTYVGQLVPQKQLLPPAEVEIAADLTTDQMIKVGFEVVQQKGLCLTCHTVGKAGAGLRFPDLAGIGDRAKTRKPGMDDVHYLAESLYHPDAYIVPGFNPGMPTINKPPIGLTDKEILTVIAWLQSLGGTPSVTMTTKLPDQTQG